MSPWRICMTAILALFLLAGIIMLSFPAKAQMLCAPLPDLLRSMKDNLGEWVVFVADAPTGRYYLTRSDDGDWSLIWAREDVGCLILTGKTSEFLKGV